MARRPLLTDEERRLGFGIPDDPDGLARQYTFTRSDQDLVAARRGAANQLGFAVQLALLRHPGMGLAHIGKASRRCPGGLPGDAQADDPGCAGSLFTAGKTPAHSEGRPDSAKPVPER
jgi:hypothetical protein